MNERPRVLVTRQIPEAGLRLLREQAFVDVWDGALPPPRDELLRRVAGVDGLLALLTDRVDDELLDAAGPQLKVVSNFAVGYDNIDVAACARRGSPSATPRACSRRRPRTWRSRSCSRSRGGSRRRTPTSATTAG